ncbi:hypothetical protein CCH79_00014369 [Gambusia affinis]|uniref:Solute carrier family 5 member 8 n=1 Tax=Gambusia affinis TaxID=33528 RepID=A0A315UTN2_GAMAF|nr:hypothetical protein CCH79_00014369 [Gambusia affinis]
MSGSSVPGSFAVADYVVFAVMLLVSAAVGVYFAWTDRRQRSAGDFLTGGRRLTALPVSMSLSASFMSAVTVLGNPAEVRQVGRTSSETASSFVVPTRVQVYRYGASIAFYAVSYVVTMLITSEVFLPVFYKLSITSTYEGGLKAVVWTDVIQLGVMLAGFLTVIIRSVVLQGGVINIISDSQQGGRLNLLDFDPSPLRRHTFWTLSIGGTFIWLSIYGINQAQVQRYISCKSMTHARLSLFINLLGLWSILLSSVFAGMCLFSVYKSCDPWTTGLISAPDQLMPYLVMDILGDYPGLPGLFVAAVYSGSLSTVSSSINALAAVTVEDIIRPYTNFSENRLTCISKGMSFFYGILCIGMAGLASFMGGILQVAICPSSFHWFNYAKTCVRWLVAAISIFGIIGGPLLGLFTLGILCPLANSKGALSGLLSGMALSLWVGIGAQIYPPFNALSQPLPLSTDGCNFTTAHGSNWTSTALPIQNFTSVAPVDHRNKSVLTDLYSLSYLYFSPLGTITAIGVGLVIKRRSGHLDLKKDRETTFGNANPAFSDLELDLSKSGLS